MPKQAGNIEVDQEFVTEVKKTVALLVGGSAILNNAIREIERNHPYADEKVLKMAMFTIKGIAGDLSAQWEELTLTIAAGDYCDMLEDGGAA